MKKRYWVILGIIAAMACSGYSEAISDELKVADCNFKILHKGEPIQIIKQVISLRATSEKGDVRYVKTSQPISNGSYGSGYRSYHLEFSYRDIRLEFDEVDKVEFYVGKTLIYVVDIENRTRVMIESEERTEQKLRYFSINLQGIPLLMLDDVTSINLVH